jgi:ADP-ribose pyrophosphatase
MSMDDEPEEVMWQGRFITAKRRGKWEYVSRARGIKAAVILAVEDGHVLLVEQYRVPLDAGEDALTSAARELEEETGYRAATLEIIGEFFSSPGMVSESFTLVRATDLSKVSDGGGVDGENIIVHRIALPDLPSFVRGKRAEGCVVDVKLLMLPGMAL